MSDEEAIAILNLDKAGHQISEPDTSTNSYWDNVIEALGKAVESLKEKSEAEKKQIPKKPKYDLQLRICGNCKCELEYLWYNYCPHCGQAIDWSDSE